MAGNVPTPMTWRSALSSTAELNAGVRDPLNFLLTRPAAELVQTVAQTFTTAVWTTLTFDAEQLDRDPSGGGGHDNAVNNSRYTAQYPGWYLFTGAVGFMPNATAFRGTRWLYNATVVTGSELLIPTTLTIAAAVPARTKRIYMNYGDYVELQGFQNSGGNLNTNVTAELQSSLGVVWEGSP